MIPFENRNALSHASDRISLQAAFNRRTWIRLFLFYSFTFFSGFWKGRGDRLDERAMVGEGSGAEE